MIDTICGNCIFATWKDKRQEGCKLNRLDKFVDQGTTLELLRDEQKDLEYYAIKERICVMLTTPEFAGRNPDIKNIAKEVRQRVALRCSCLIVVNEESMNEIEQTVASLVEQELLPAEIVLIINSDSVRPLKVRRMLQELEKKRDYIWRIVHMHERGPENEKLASDEYCLDHTIQKLEIPFYAVFMPGFVVPKSFLADIDYALNDELERFSMLLPIDDWNGAVVQTALHKALQGNAPEKLEQYEDGELIATTIMDKIEYIARQNKQEHMIKQVYDICPAMKKLVSVE